MNVMQMRGDMVFLKRVKLQPPAGLSGATFQKSVPPFEIGRTPVSNAQFRSHLVASADQRFGALLFGRAGRVLEVVRGEVEAAVNDQLLEAEQRVSQDGDITIFTSPVRELVPTVDAWEQRFAQFERGAREYLADDHHAVFVSWFEAVTFAHAVECRLPTDVEWHRASLYGTSRDSLKFDPRSMNFAVRWHWSVLDEGVKTKPKTSSIMEPTQWVPGRGIDRGGLHLECFIFEWMGGWSAHQLQAGFTEWPLDAAGEYLPRPLRGQECFYPYGSGWISDRYLATEADPTQGYVSAGFRLARDVA